MSRFCSFFDSIIWGASFPDLDVAVVTSGRWEEVLTLLLRSVGILSVLMEASCASNMSRFKPSWLLSKSESLLRIWLHILRRS